MIKGENTIFFSKYNNYIYPIHAISVIQGWLFLTAQIKSEATKKG
jgi:hypothetical protein